MKLRETVVFHFLSRVGLSAIGFLATVYFARVLGAEVLGTYFVVVALVSWLSVPTAGVSKAMEKRVSEGECQREYQGAGVVVMLGIGIIFSVILLVFEDIVDSYVGATIAGLTSVIFFANVLLQIVTGGLRGQKRIAHSASVDFINKAIQVISQVVLILIIGTSVMSLILGYSIGLLVATFAGLLLFSVGVSVPNLKQIYSLYNYAKYSWISALDTRTFSWTDVIVLSFFVQNNLIGVYEISWRLASMLSLISVSIITTLFPEISDLSTDNQIEEVHRLLEESLVFVGVFLIPGFVGALVLSEELLRIYGDEFVIGRYILLILILARAVDAYKTTFTTFINGVDKPDVAFKINVVFILSNVLLNILLIYIFGWHGAAIATLVSGLIALFLSGYALSRMIGRFSVPYQEISKQFFASILMGVIVKGLSEVIPRGEIYTVALVFIGATIYMIAVALLSNKVRSKIVSLLPGRVASQ